MSLHAETSPEARRRLGRQKRVSTFSSMAIALLSTVLIALVLGLFLIRSHGFSRCGDHGLHVPQGYCGCPPTALAHGALGQETIRPEPLEREGHVGIHALSGVDPHA